jgi:predicted O-methyltransferase YrrM
VAPLGVGAEVPRLVVAAPVTFTERWFCEESQSALEGLYRTVADLDGAVIEVGSWEGRSTLALSKACYPHTLHAVDTWEGSPGEISATLAADRDVHATFVDNMRRLSKGNVEPHRMGWREFFASWDQPIRLLFIDAEHSYVEVRDNIEAALPLMVPGGIVCGDDNHHPPIQRAIIDVFGDAMLTATLWWVRC